MTEKRHNLNPHVYIGDSVAYIALPMPDEFEPGMIVNGLVSEFFDPLIDDNDLAAIQVAFLTGKDICILGFADDDYAEILGDMNLRDEHQAGNLTIEQLDKLQAHYLHLRGDLKSGEHLYAVVSEYMQAIEENTPIPKTLAGMRLIKATIDSQAVKESIGQSQPQRMMA